MKCLPLRKRLHDELTRAGGSMVEKRYEWADGAKLEEHSKRKHKILREYVFDYLTVRCKLPQQERFRLAIVDGFAGAAASSRSMARMARPLSVEPLLDPSQ